MSHSLDLQHQDLTVYQDSSIVSHKILTPSYNYLNLILHQQSTKPAWLNLALIENCLLDTCYLNTTKSQHRSDGYDLKMKEGGKSKVIFASFVNGSGFYYKQFKKFLNIDLKAPIEVTSKYFKYLDFLVDNTHWFETIETQLNTMLKDISNIDKKINLFLENPEILLFLNPGLPTNQLLQNLQSLNQRCNLFIVSSSDKSLLEFSEFETDLATLHSTFLMKLMHKSNIIISLKPLKTGRADDVSGELKINKGLIENPVIDVIEKEYLYLASKDGTIKLFYR